VEFIAANPELIGEIRGKVMDALKLGGKTGTTASGDDAEEVEAMEA
jgi:hypothetical protein